MAARLPRLAKWLLVALALIVTYGAVGTWLVPWLAKPRIERAASEALGRTLSIGELRVYPFQFRVQFRDVVLAGGGDAPTLAIAKLSLDYAPLSLISGAHHLHFVRIERPALRIARDTAGRFDVPLPTPSADEANARPLRWRLDELRVDDGSVTLVDAGDGVAQTLALRALSFGARDLAVDDAGAPGRIVLNAIESGGAELRIAGEVDARDGSARIVTVTRGIHPALVNPRLTALGLPTLDALDADATLTLTRSAGGALRIDDSALLLRGLALDAGGERIAIGALGLAGASVDLDARRARIDAIGIRDGSVPISRNADGRLGLLALLDRPGPRRGDSDALEISAAGSPGADPAPAADAATPALASDTPAFSWSIGTIVIDNLELPYRDAGFSPPLALDLRLRRARLGPIAAPAGEDASVDLALGVGAEGGITVRGTAAPFAPSAQVDVSLAKLDLRPFAGQVGELARLDLESGAVEGALKVTLNEPGARPRVAVTGTVAVRNFATVDSIARRDFVNFDALEASGINATVEPLKVDIARVRAARLFARVIVAPDRRTNIQDILGAPVVPVGDAEIDAAPESGAGREASGVANAAATSPVAPVTASPLPFSIRRIDIVNARMRFADLSLTPRFMTTIERLSGRIAGLSSAPGARATVDLKGEVDALAPVTIAGSLNPFRGAENTDIAMVFRNVELASMTPYSGRFAGYTINSGKLNLDLRYVIRDGALAGDNKVVLDQLVLGAAVDSPDAVSLPIKLIVALLKDSEGRIDLAIPVEGDLNDPTVRMGPLIWQAVFKILGNIAAAPFRMLGGLFGGDGDAEALSTVLFDAGSAAPVAAEAADFDKVAAALAKRPALTLSIRGIADPTIDRTALERAALSAALGDAKADPEREAAALIALHSARIGRAPSGEPEAPGWFAGDDAEAAYRASYDEWLGDVRAAVEASFAVDDPALLALASQRADAIAAALAAAGVAPERISRDEPALEDGHASNAGIASALGLIAK